MRTSRGRTPSAGLTSALLLHALDHARGPVVADPQPPLQPGDRGLLALRDELHGLVVHLVGETLVLDVLRFLLVRFVDRASEVLVEDRADLILQEADDLADLRLGHVRAVDARERAASTAA